ncbi:MAG: lysophospholipid acyltransferase family protein [Cyclobacteriaceae bacterium]|nr:lysophospholipid acyltransferase family protein [Cyclobacteriaceae bacterium]
MHKLVSLDQFSKASGIRNKFMAGIIMRFAGLHKLNALYNKLYPHKDLSFIEEFLSQAHIQLEVDESELARIPQHGAFITVSNHPYGGLDGLVLIYLVAKRRADYKILANFLLKRIEPIQHYFISVNPFEDFKHVASSVTGMKLAKEQLAAGCPIGIFPAGEVSTWQKKRKGITDREWQKPAIKLARKAQVPVIPIYFHGHNRWSFHLLGLIHPLLRTLRLPRELTATHKRIVRVRIGSPISVKEQGVFSNADQLGDYLRAKTYSLGSVLTKKITIPKLYVGNKPEPEVIKDGISTELLAEDLTRIGSCKLVSQQNFDLYLAPAQLIPNVLFEIGRLREITFRHEGEGTNKGLDLDAFDQYYQHLFLYDRVAMQIVGAYRIGMGKEILHAHGKKGFYTNTLFRMQAGFVPILGQAVELGRSFIIPAYQNKRLPLFLLWRGILTVLKKNPEYRYIIGPVSISNYYSQVSKSLIVAFIQRHYFDQNLAQFIKPRKKYKVDKTILTEAATLLDSTGNDIKKLDKIIDDIEPAIKSAPVLLKKYIHQNARIIGFNIDPDFNLALDGFMILDIAKLPQETINNLNLDWLKD